MTQFQNLAGILLSIQHVVELFEKMAWLFIGALKKQLFNFEGGGGIIYLFSWLIFISQISFKKINWPTPLFMGEYDVG